MEALRSNGEFEGMSGDIFISFLMCDFLAFTCLDPSTGCYRSTTARLFSIRMTIDLDPPCLVCDSASLPSANLIVSCPRASSCAQAGYECR